MELVTVWDGSVHRHDRGLLDEIRGITGHWSAIHEPRSLSAPVVRCVPKYGARKPMTRRIVDAIFATEEHGVTTQEILEVTNRTVTPYAIANTLFRLHRRGLIRSYAVRKGQRGNRYWATEHAPEGTR